MASRNELVIRANAVGIDPALYPNDSKLEQKVLYLEKNATTFAGTLGTGTLTSDATNQDDGDKVLIGNRTYTYRTALSDPTVADEVLLGNSAATTLDNLKLAINATDPETNEGVKYSVGTGVHTQVTATTNTDTTQVVQAREYAITNADIATTDPVDAGSHMAWGAATLGSGVRNQRARVTSTTAGGPGVSGDANVL